MKVVPFCHVTFMPSFSAGVSKVKFTGNLPVARVSGERCAFEEGAVSSRGAITSLIIKEKRNDT